MPVGIQRLNAKKSQPNPSIVFIKPLPGPFEKVAQDFLERIAAQCLPVMRKHHLSVMSLEEYEPNREFVGRNFNAGEVIQLVLRSPSTGRWLPFHYVQMVMMHELAHCKQMNHSRAFWAVRNTYAEQMRELWGQGYTGNGVWGRGANLGTGEWETRQVSCHEALPEHLCGGTYRSRRKRRRRATMTTMTTTTYKEREERRVLKKFGAKGVTLGADEGEKLRLEGKMVKGKPRVAGSARGRDLRAAAALARFEKQRTESDEELDDGDDDDDDDDDDVDDDAVDVDGSSMLDRQGRSMVKVCEDEDVRDADASKELSQLRDMLGPTWTRVKEESREDDSRVRVKEEPLDDVVVATPKSPPRLSQPRQAPEANVLPPRRSAKTASHQPVKQENVVDPRAQACALCSFDNAPSASTCGMCANVLRPSCAPDAWRCHGVGCSREYVNAGDCGVCGLCGQRREVRDGGRGTGL